MGCGFDTMGTGVGYSAASYYQIYFTQDFGCSRDDFNCQCPQIVDPATAAPPAPVPAPVCVNGVAVPAAVPAAAPAPGVSLVRKPARGRGAQLPYGAISQSRCWFGTGGRVWSSMGTQPAATAVLCSWRGQARRRQPPPLAAPGWSTLGLQGLRGPWCRSLLGPSRALLGSSAGLARPTR